MKITDIRVRICEPGEKQTRLKGLASITFDDEFVVHNIKIIENSKGLFVGMPSIKDANGEFKDICHPLNTSLRNDISSAILAKYEEITA